MVHSSVSAQAPHRNTLSPISIFTHGIQFSFPALAGPALVEVFRRTMAKSLLILFCVVFLRSECTRRHVIPDPDMSRSLAFRVPRALRVCQNFDRHTYQPYQQYLGSKRIHHEQCPLDLPVVYWRPSVGRKRWLHCRLGLTQFSSGMHLGPPHSSSGAANPAATRALC